MTSGKSFERLFSMRSIGAFALLRGHTSPSLAIQTISRTFWQRNQRYTSNWIHAAFGNRPQQKGNWSLLSSTKAHRTIPKGHSAFNVFPSKSQSSLLSSSAPRCAEAHHPNNGPLWEREKAGNDEHTAKLLKLSLKMSRTTPNVDISIRCTEFASDGSVIRAGQEIDKAKLTADYGLQTRDLRKLDLNSSSLPYIFVRPTTMIVNLVHLRLLIQADRVLIVDTEDSGDIQSIFAYNLKQKLSDKSQSPLSPHLPFELRAFEAVLISATSELEAELILVRDPIIEILQELEHNISVDEEILRRLLDRSKKLGRFTQKTRQVRDALQDLLEADDDLAEMYFTDSRNGKPHATNDHQEAELLIESYHKICDGIVEVCERLQDDVTKTDETIKSVLDANRNQIILLDVKVSMAALGLGTGTLIAGLYGMNLVNFMEEAQWGFVTVSSVCFALSAVVFIAGRRMLNKIQWRRIRGGKLS